MLPFLSLEQAKLLSYVLRTVGHENNQSSERPVKSESLRL